MRSDVSNRAINGQHGDIRYFSQRGTEIPPDGGTNTSSNDLEKENPGQISGRGCFAVH